MSEDGAMMAANPAKLFVGNLNYKMTSDDLRAAFAEFGEVVESIVMSDKFSGRSKGFGFVTFATPEQAQTALEALNGKEVMERQIFVSVARPPQPRQNRFNDRRGGDRGGFHKQSYRDE